MATKFDSRQIISRDLLQQLFPNISGKQLDLLLRSINTDLTPPLRAEASSTPNLIVTIGPSVVVNSESGRKKSIPHIQSSIPNFTSGTVQFPAANGGLIVVTPGNDLTLNCPANNYVKVLFCLDSLGDLVVVLGTPNVAENSANVPAIPANTLPFAYVSVFNNAGTVQPITQSSIYQLTGGGGGGGSVQAGAAQEVVIANGATSVSVTFPTPFPGTNYVVLPSFVNLVDPNPQFQDIVVTNKTTSGFTATWNAPVDSANYKLGYIVPVVQEQVGEAIVGSGVTSVTVTLPIALAGTNYVVIASLVNIVDGTPQFQSVDITGKTNTTFSVSWNAPTDSANYRLAYHVAQYQ